MFDFHPDPSLNATECYRQLCDAADSLTSGEIDKVANMANVAALIWEFVPDLNWAGFYRMGLDAHGARELVLGPFVGRPACIRIPLDKGVCGASARDSATKVVDDVHAFPGHIACDANSRSELVVPVMRDKCVVALIDLDSPIPSRFGAEDARGIEQLAALLKNRI